MIHRAILGSLERFIAIITENFAGKWSVTSPHTPSWKASCLRADAAPRPFWLNPRQIIVIPVSTKYTEYADKVAQTFRDAGLFADVDDSANTLNKMIRNAQIGQWSFILGELSRA